MEKWVPIGGYESSYQVSNQGRVKSIDRLSIDRRGRTRRIEPRTLKLKNNGSGYMFVTLCMRGQTRNFYVHRLVAEAFLKNKFRKAFVNHIDGNPSNNEANNLEWVTHAENIQHAYDNGLFKQKGTGRRKKGKEKNKCEERKRSTK